MRALLAKPGLSVAGQQQTQRRGSIDVLLLKAWPLDQQLQPALGASSRAMGSVCPQGTR